MKRKHILFPILCIFLLYLSACASSETPPDQTTQDGQESSAAAQDERPTRDPTEEELARYTAAMKAFGLQPEDYEFFTYLQPRRDTFFSGSELVGLMDLIQNKSGDAVPAFYWDDAQATLFVLKEDSSGTFHLYTVQRADDPDLSDHDFTKLWNQVENERTTTLS